jgi:hypothetical protein
MRIELVALERNKAHLTRTLGIKDKRLEEVVRVVKSLLLRRNGTHDITSWN